MFNEDIYQPFTQQNHFTMVIGEVAGNQSMDWFQGQFQGQLTGNHGQLVGGWATPLKNMKVNWDDDVPNIWKNKKCSKPPTSHDILGLPAKCPFNRWWEWDIPSSHPLKYRLHYRYLILLEGFTFFIKIHGTTYSWVFPWLHLQLGWNGWILIVSSSYILNYPWQSLASFLELVSRPISWLDCQGML